MSSNADLAGGRAAPLPVTIVAGQSIFDLADGTLGIVRGITDAFCIYEVQAARLAITSWRDIALANVRPAAPLLPADVAANDVRNASARFLRELLALELVTSLTGNQQRTRAELVALLCGT